MKCVCPMGGDRTCPDNCLIAVWHSLPEDQRTKDRRRPMVEALAKQGYTQEAIGIQLGVSHQTIGRDLETLSIVDNVKGQGRDTRGRKKSTGRPKGGRKERIKNTADTLTRAAELFLDKGMTRAEVMAETGITENQVQLAVERERGRREAIPDIDPATLSLTTQQKFEAAIAAHKRKLDLEFRDRILDEVRRRIDEMILPEWKRRIEEAKKLYKHRRGAMDKATFNKIRRALHPDSRNSISDKVLAEAFDTFMNLEKFLLDEEASPTEIGPVPDSLAEWDKMRATANAKRKAKRSGSLVRH